MPEEPAAISVIVPIYNGRRFLAEALASIEGQSRRDFEIIAIDDGSTDESASVVLQFPAVRYFYQENAGVAAARNAGLSVARGALLTFIDQDDVWAPRKLELQAEYMSQRREVGCLIGREHLFGNGRVAAHGAASRLGVHLGSMMIRREVFEAIGRFDTSYRIASDLDWVMRARDRGIVIEAQSEVVVNKRVHEHNESHAADLNKRERMRALKASIDRKRGKG